MARTEAEKKAQQKYLRSVMQRVYFDLNKNTDADILSALEKNGVAPYIKRLIREDLARAATENGESVKRTVYELRTTIIGGDSFSDWLDEYSAAKDRAAHEIAHLTVSERENRDVEIIGYEIDVPCAYDYRDAESLRLDLDFEDVEVPQFDKLLGGFSDSAQSFYIKLK